MKHHFGDLLDRSGDHWTVVPNRERHCHGLERIDAGDPAVRVVLIGAQTRGWERALALPNLEEVTLHEPTAAQVEATGRCLRLRRLRITHFRAKDIEALAGLVHLEELVLEYVSGFSDLAPLARLPKLRSLHLENLRRVDDFSGLAGCTALRYLAILGTLDWNQPIAGFGFLRGLANLESLALMFVRTAHAYPAFLPAVALGRLQSLRIAPNEFATDEYALLSVVLEGVPGTDWGPFRRRAWSDIPLPKGDPRSSLDDAQLQARYPEVLIDHKGRRRIANPDDEWFEFTGKRAGRVKCTHPASASRCAEAAQRYAAMQAQARALLATSR
jgi:hypothetical protein